MAGHPVSSVLCFPHHIPVTHLVDTLTKSLILVTVWETGVSIASSFLALPYPGKRGFLSLCVSLPPTPNSSAPVREGNAVLLPCSLLVRPGAVEQLPWPAGQPGRGEGLGVAPSEVELVVFVSCFFVCVLWYLLREKKCEQSRRWENGSRPQCALPHTFPLVVGNPYLAK